MISFECSERTKGAVRSVVDGIFFIKQNFKQAAYMQEHLQEMLDFFFFEFPADLPAHRLWYKFRSEKEEKDMKKS